MLNYMVLAPIWSVTAVIWTMAYPARRKTNSIIFTLHDIIFCTVHSISYNMDAEILGYLFLHGSDFSKQTTISADSKIINSGRTVADRGPPTKRRYITSQGEIDATDGGWYHILPPSPGNDVEEASPVSAVQTSRARKKWELRTTTEKIKQSARQRRKNKVESENR